MTLGDPGRDRQSQAQPTRWGVGRSPEPLEHVPDVFGSDPAARVLDLEHGRGSFAGHVHLDLGRSTGVPDRVVDEDHRQLAETREIARDRGGLTVELEAHAALGGDRAELAHGGGRGIRQVNSPSLKLDHARVSASQQKQALDEVRHVLDLGAHVLERCPNLAHGLIRVAAQVLERAPQDGQRRAKLVRRIRRELALAAQRIPYRHERARGVEPPAR